MYNRADIVDARFVERVRAADFPAAEEGASLAEAGLSRTGLIDLLDTQIASRHLDLMARRTKGDTFYSIGSAGHEAMAALAEASRPDDIAFLHYRDAAFVIHRRKRIPGATPLYDMALSFAASSEDPVSGGRHKVLGGADIHAPPQTSTIASHLPKAVGAAHSIGVLGRGQAPTALPRNAVVLCSFGDASANHSTAQGAINAACWASYQNSPMPIVFICEDNNIGISVRTPRGWIEAAFAHRAGLAYRRGNGLDLVHSLAVAREAVDYARQRRRPVFLHLETVRLLGHAGADVEAAYSGLDQVEAAEAKDPLLHTARRAVDEGGLTTDEIIARYEDMRARINRVAREAFSRPKIKTSEEAASPLAPPPATFRAALPPADEEARSALFESDARALAKPAPLARHISFALADIMLQYENSLVFGEDVARKGGVYGVTKGLLKKFGPARVMDTLLDEQTILGLAIGAAHNGFVAIPEIQFLAYLHNAEDQLRGEASTLSFFSNGQYQNPMVVRIASLGYQKGFGGHFHNDNSIAVLRDIPGLIIACPSNGADAAPMLRECMRLAHEEGRVVVFLEPIALYQTADLHEENDQAWLSAYAPPSESSRISLGEHAQHGDGRDLCIVSYANGYYLSRQAQKRLSEQHGLASRVIDLRWLAPLNRDAIADACAPCRSVLIVDECRHTGSLSEELVSALYERNVAAPVKRLTADDCFIPLGPAATAPLPSVDGIVAAGLDVALRNAKAAAE